MGDEYKKRLKEIAKPILEIVLIGIVYYIFISLTGLSIPCPIRLITGKYCPGCGITRMCLGIIKGDFAEAFLANRFLFVLLPWMLLYGIVKGVYYIVTGNQKANKYEQVGVLLLFVATIVFWILRNMDSYSFLAPIG